MSHILLLGLGYCTTKTLLDDFIYFNLQNEKLFEENESMRETSSSERSSRCPAMINNRHSQKLRDQIKEK